MPFRADFCEYAAQRVGYRCEACGLDMRPKKSHEAVDYVLHSATSLHLLNGPGRYLVYDPPSSMRVLKGKRILAKYFQISQMGRSDDAICLCPDCHLAVGNLATIEAKVTKSKSKGKLILPIILERVTLDYIYSKSKERP